jgi:Family of unknown function (DUF6267)
MINYQDYLTESKEGKNLHLEHLEDEVLNGGVSGTRGAISFLQSLRDMLAGHATGRTVNLTTKWDGAPAIFAGINPENGKFFVGTKGVFAQNAKLNYTNADIDNNHPGEGLNAKLKVALRYLPELGIDGVLQGDMMFTSADLKTETIDGKSYVTFQPNTIVYAVPADSKLAENIKSSKMGIVWHTTYNGDTMADMTASFGADIGGLNQSRNVWFRDASFVDATGTATFTKQETDTLNSILSQAGSLFRTISPRTLNTIATNDTYKIAIKAWNNLKVREGKEITNTTQHVAGLIATVEEKLNKSILEAKKADTKQKRQQEKKIVMDFYQSNKNELKKIFDLQNLLVRAKNMVVKKLQSVQDSVGTYLRVDDKGLKVTAPEGFVAIDKIGKAVKLVDRLEFSQANFNATKNWSK